MEADAGSQLVEQIAATGGAVGVIGWILWRQQHTWAKKNSEDHSKMWQAISQIERTLERLSERVETLYEHYRETYRGARRRR